MSKKRPAATPRRRAQTKWSAADRSRAFHEFVETDSLRETSRRTGVPLGTLAGWLDDPQHADDLERIRTAHARAVTEEDGRLAREAAAGLREGVSVCRELLGRRGKIVGPDGQGQDVPACDGKEAAALTRALLHTSVELDRRARLGRGEATDRLEFVSEEAAAVKSELAGLLAKPHVQKALKRLAAG